jgi:uncharacterized GH25 family protein
MKRIALSLILTFAVVVPLQAHFLFLVPEGNGQAVNLIFSDSLEPDRAELMAKVTGTKVWFRPASGPSVDLKWTDKKEAFHIAAPAGQSGLATASLKYGVITKGEQPFLLNYYASAWAGKEPVAAAKADPQLPLQIVPHGGRSFQVVWQGKPLADAVVAFVGGEKGEVKSDAQGVFAVPADRKGLVGMRVRQVEEKAGALDGKAYKEVRSYATLVVPLK